MSTGTVPTLQNQVTETPLADIAAAVGVNPNDTFRVSGEDEPKIPVAPSEPARVTDNQVPASEPPSAGQQPASQPQPDAAGEGEGQDDWLTPALIARAHLYGISEQQARRFSNAEGVEQAINIASNTLLQTGQMQPQQQPYPPQQPQEQSYPEQYQQPQQYPQPQMPPGQDAPKFPVEPYTPSFSTEDMEEGAAKEFQSIEGVIKNQVQYLQGLTDMVLGLQEQMYHDQEARYVSEFDRLVEGAVGEYPDLEPLLGKGPWLSMQPTMLEHQGRTRLDQTLRQFYQAFNSNGQYMPLDKVFSEALRNVFNAQLQNQNQGANGNGSVVDDRVRDRRGRFVSADQSGNQPIPEVSIGNEDLVAVMNSVAKECNLELGDLQFTK